jgi:hypothetical protein
MSNSKSRGLSLDALRLRAKIDYLTVHTDQKVSLPKLKGRAIWPKSQNGTLLTVHDATADDVAALMATLGSRRLHELEVCIDFSCRRAVPLERRRSVLSGVMVDLFAKGLYPREGAHMEAAARTFYRRLETRYEVRPFNRRLPRESDQQLHGWRGDWAQVKVYLKRTDMGKRLDESDHVARVEVRLRGDGLHQNGLEMLSDLVGFKFRKTLSPYFRVVRGTTLKAARDKVPTPTLHLLREWKQHFLDDEWQETGVGSVQTGGKTAHLPHRLLRDFQINERIGQALHRLEQSFREEKFVCLESVQNPAAPMLARAFVRSSQSAMTFM